MKLNLWEILQAFFSLMTIKLLGLALVVIILFGLFKKFAGRVLK